MAKFKEIWKPGKEAGCVVSDALNRHGVRDEANHVEYYGGYLVAESIPKKEFVKLIGIAPEMYSKLEELERVIKEWPMLHPGGDYLHGWILTSIRDLLNKVRGESEAQDG